MDEPVVSLPWFHLVAIKVQELITAENSEKRMPATYINQSYKQSSLKLFFVTGSIPGTQHMMRHAILDLPAYPEPRIGWSTSKEFCCTFI